MTETTMTRRRGRKLAGILAGALALGMVPFAAPASAQTDPLPAPRDIGDFACPVDDQGTPDTDDDTTEVPEDGFTDVATTNVHEFSIDCIVWYEVARGTSATTYNPGGNITRDQMASFIAQLIDYAFVNGTGQQLPAVPTGNQFPCDVTNANIHYSNIQRLAEAGVVSGTGSSTAGACYNPGGNVTRAQMATFIKQAQEFINGLAIGSTNPILADYFADDEGDTHENNINIIADESIARGTGTDANNDNIYNPGGFVRRDQMASFLANKLDVLVDAGTTEPPPTVVDVSADDETPDQGQDIAVTVESTRANIEAVTITGCGLVAPDTDEMVFGSAGTTETVAALTIPAAQPTGTCTLTIETELDPTHPLTPAPATDGIVITSTLEITVNAA